jgi:hypothetical protein
VPRRGLGHAVAWCRCCGTPATQCRDALPLHERLSLATPVLRNETPLTAVLTTATGDGAEARDSWLGGGVYAARVGVAGTSGRPERRA